MSASDVEAVLRAAKELPDGDIPALAQILAVPAQPAQPAQPAPEVSRSRYLKCNWCSYAADWHWLDGHGNRWYGCEQHMRWWREGNIMSYREAVE